MDKVEQRAWELLEAECSKPLPFDVPVHAALSAIRAALAQQPAAEPRSTHRVWRRNDWLPCYCEATSDHHIGCEQQPEARGGGEVVAWMTPGGDVSRSFYWCLERCLPGQEPQPLYAAPPSAPVGVELSALRVQEWLHREHDILCPVQEIEQAMRTPCSCPFTERALAQQPAARPPKPTECMNGCPDRQVCGHCQWPPGPDQQPAAVNEARSGSSIMDGAVSFVEALTAQRQEPKS